MRTRHLALIFFASFVWALVSGCAKPPSGPQMLYVNPPVTYLRDAPDLNSPAPVELTAGDQLESLEMTETGWCKVRSVRTNLSGWIPRELLVENPPPKPTVTKPKEPRLPIYYVAVVNLKLREQPTFKSKVVGNLPFKSKVEKLNENPIGWFQVREAGTNSAGWAPKGHLEAFMLEKPRLIMLAKRKPSQKTPESGIHEKALLPRPENAAPEDVPPLPHAM